MDERKDEHKAESHEHKSNEVKKEGHSHAGHPHSHGLKKEGHSHSHEHKESHAHHKKHNKTKSSKFLYFIIILLGIIGVVNLILTMGLFSTTKDKITEMKELARPAELELILLVNSGCDDCFNLGPLLESLKAGNVEILDEKEIEFSSEEGKELIEKYGVEKIPALIISGEIDKLDDTGFNLVEENLVYDNDLPPFTNAIDGKIQGLVKAIILEHPKCDDCFDVTPIIEIMKEGGVSIVEERTLSTTSSEAIGLIDSYKIEKFPAIVFSEDLSLYEAIEQSWAQLGSVESDGTYIYRELSAPYFDAGENRIVGEVDLIYLTDNSCDTCYNVSRHKPIILGFGINPSEEYIDVSSDAGKKLVEKYNIQFVPTIILMGDSSFYPSLVSVWPQVGKVDDDGSYIFTNVAVMRGPYTDLESGDVVVPGSTSN